MAKRCGQAGVNVDYFRFFEKDGEYSYQELEKHHQGVIIWEENTTSGGGCIYAELEDSDQANLGFLLEQQMYINGELNFDSVDVSEDEWKVLWKASGDELRSGDKRHACYLVDSKQGFIRACIRCFDYKTHKCTTFWFDPTENNGNIKNWARALGVSEIQHMDVYDSYRIMENVQTGVKRDVTPKKETTSSDGSSSGGCYIATCVYGSYDCPEVWTLRRFRDQVLQKSILGRCFVRVYYATSPSLVRKFGQRAWFCSMGRMWLDKLVRKLRANGVESSPYFDDTMK